MFCKRLQYYLIYDIFDCMQILLEILFRIIAEPILTLLFEKPLDELEQSTKLSRMPKWCRILIFTLICLVMTCVLFLIVFGTILLIIVEVEQDRKNGLIMLLCGLSGLLVYVVTVLIRINTDKRRNRRRVKPAGGVRPDRTALRRLVHVVVDRQLGSTHPKHSNIVYPVNYGFVPGIMGGDGEAQDAYILGADEPLSEFDGVVVAIIHRLDDDEDKWVVAPQGVSPTDEEILGKTEFQEKYFHIELIRR